MRTVEKSVESGRSASEPLQFLADLFYNSQVGIGVRPQFQHLRIRRAGLCGLTRCGVKARQVSMRQHPCNVAVPWRSCFGENPLIERDGLFLMAHTGQAKREGK